MGFNNKEYKVYVFYTFPGCDVGCSHLERVSRCSTPQAVQGGTAVSLWHLTVSLLLSLIHI